MGISNLPSIWAGSYSSGEEWFVKRDALLETRSIIETIDDSKLVSRKGFSMRAYCSQCRDITDMGFTGGSRPLRLASFI